MYSQIVAFKSISADKDFNLRSNYEGKENGVSLSIPELADSIKRDGLINPLTVRVNAEGGYDLVAGFRRHAALSTLGVDTVQVQVYEGDNFNTYMLNMKENAERKSLTAYELAARCTYIVDNVPLKDGKPATGADIARSIAGMSKGYINNLIRVYRALNPKILKAWEAGHPLATTDRLNALATHEKGEQLDAKILKITGEPEAQSWSELVEGVKDVKKGGCERNGGKEHVWEGELCAKCGEAKPAKAVKVTRPDAATIAEAIKRAKKGVPDAAERKLVIACLKWAAGLADALPWFNPKAEAEERKAAKKAEAEEKAAEAKAVKEIERLEKEAKAKAEKATKAEA